MATVPQRGVIYGLRCTCHPGDGIRYVGQTTARPNTRFSQHKWSARNGEVWPVCRWIRKHGEDNIVMDTLQEFTDPAMLDEMEQSWINRLGTLHGTGGLNLQPGGSSIRGYKHALDAKSRIGRPLSEEQKSKISATLKAKSAKGDRAYYTKLNSTLAADIKRQIWLGRTGVDIAEEYGVSNTTIYLIKEGRNWQDAPWPIGPCKPSPTGFKDKGSVPDNAKLTPNKVRDIRRLSESGASTEELALQFGVTTTNIRYIIKRVTWANVW